MCTCFTSLPAFQLQISCSFLSHSSPSLVLVFAAVERLDAHWRLMLQHCKILFVAEAPLRADAFPPWPARSTVQQTHCSLHAVVCFYVMSAPCSDCYRAESQPHSTPANNKLQHNWFLSFSFQYSNRNLMKKKWPNWANLQDLPKPFGEQPYLLESTLRRN